MLFTNTIWFGNNHKEQEGVVNFWGIKCSMRAPKFCRHWISLSRKFINFQNIYFTSYAFHYVFQVHSLNVGNKCSFLKFSNYKNDILPMPFVAVRFFLFCLLFLYVSLIYLRWISLMCISSACSFIVITVTRFYYWCTYNLQS